MSGTTERGWYQKMQGTWAVNEALERAAWATGLTKDEILGPSRKSLPCEARFAVIWACRPKSSLNKLGRALGRDHTTIVSSYRRAKELYQKDEAFRALCDEVAA